MNKREAMFLARKVIALNAMADRLAEYGLWEEADAAGELEEKFRDRLARKE